VSDHRILWLALLLYGFYYSSMASVVLVAS
jgi:hypothetical protein